MLLNTSKDPDINYLAKIVEVTYFYPHPNADNLKLCNVNNCTIAVSCDVEEGLFIYFPIECEINSEYLSHNNLYRDSSLNLDSEKKGFFEKNNRVRCVKLRGLPSEGLIMPIDSLSFISKDLSCKVNTEFDTVNNLRLVKKYVLPVSPMRTQGNSKRKNAVSKSIVNNQFRFHINTTPLQKDITVIDPDDLIQISIKEHGTSAIFCNLLVNKKLTFKEKLCSKLLKLPIVKTEYKTFCASRTVIKDPVINPTKSLGFYDYDIWNTALEIVQPYLIKGMTIYAEIVGYLQTGSMIQKGYDYGCIYDSKQYDYSKMTASEMLQAKLFKIVVYRITTTNIDGKVQEWSTQQVKEFVKTTCLESVKELYYGKAKDLYPTITKEQHWHENFFNELKSNFLEKQSVLCNNNVPEEGVVIRKEVLNINVYKLKSVAFLERETKSLDKGEIDIETEN